MLILQKPVDLTVAVHATQMAAAAQEEEPLILGLVQIAYMLV